MLSHDVSRGKCTTLEYLEITFSVMVFYQGTLEPVVLAIGEDYDTLLQDFHHIFANQKIKEKMKRENTRMGLMEIVWWKKWGGGALPLYDSLVTCGNTIAMLRHLKSKNGMDYISIHGGRVVPVPVPHAALPFFVFWVIRACYLVNTVRIHLTPTITTLCDHAGWTRKRFFLSGLASNSVTRGVHFSPTHHSKHNNPSGTPYQGRKAGHSVCHCTYRP